VKFFPKIRLTQVHCVPPTSGIALSSRDVMGSLRSSCLVVFGRAYGGDRGKDNRAYIIV